MLGEGSQMGDKCSVKKSVIGRHCRIGSNVKVCHNRFSNLATFLFQQGQSPSRVIIMKKGKIPRT